MTKETLKTQVGGDHYKRLKLQPIEYIIANNLNFVEGNVIKYVTRHSLKSGLEDLKKALHYIQILIEIEEARLNDKSSSTDL